MGWGVTLKDCQLKMGGAMVSRGTAVAHKLSGTESSPTSSEILCKGQEECQHFGEDRQHISQSIHQSLWGDAFLSNECPDDGDMEMVPRQRHLLTAEDLPGVENLITDGESWTLQDHCDWIMHPHISTIQ